MMQSFDAALGMFREEGKPIDYQRLQFLRWLLEEGRLEHPPAGPPSGPFTQGLAEAVASVSSGDRSFSRRL